MLCTIKARIENNIHLSSADQRLALDGRKKVVAELRKNGGKMKRKKNKSWQEQSSSLRDAIRSARDYK